MLIPIISRPVRAEGGTHIRLLQLLQLDFPQDAVPKDQKFNNSLKEGSFIIRTEFPKKCPTT